MMKPNFKDPAEVRKWLEADETAQTMLERMHERSLPTIRPMPPLHRVPLHGRNVLEIAGPSGSGKSELLLQSAASCILPGEWNGIKIGGSEKPVLYFDLDGRFDLKRLVNLLEFRICEAKRKISMGSRENHAAFGVQTTSFKNASVHQIFEGKDFTGTAASYAGDECKCPQTLHSIKSLIGLCLKRFYLKCCYTSFEFLAALKTVGSHMKRVATEHGSSAELVIVDSIGAFYWVERSTQTASGNADRQSLTLQTVSRAVVTELHQLVHVYPKLLIMATKALILKNWEMESLRFKSWQDGRNKLYVHRPGFRRLPTDVFAAHGQLSKGTIYPGHTGETGHRDFLPASWRGFVTHRILLEGPYQSVHSPSFFVAKWDRPCPGHTEFFTIQADGIKVAC